MSVKQIARYLRQRQTPAESIFWEVVRNRRLNGKKFLRQHPIVFEISNEKRFFIADFYCAEQKLVIELDGKIHERQKDYDEMRTWIIDKLGCKVIRFNNEEILQDVEQVKRETLNYLI